MKDIVNKPAKWLVDARPTWYRVQYFFLIKTHNLRQTEAKIHCCSGVFFYKKSVISIRQSTLIKINWLYSVCYHAGMVLAPNLRYQPKVIDLTSTFSFSIFVYSWQGKNSRDLLRRPFIIKAAPTCNSRDLLCVILSRQI
jgi:hypothetical protein